MSLQLQDPYPTSWIRSCDMFPREEIPGILRCTKGLRAIRISAYHVHLPLEDIILPELKYLDINARYYTMAWLRSSSLTHLPSERSNLCPQAN